MPPKKKQAAAIASVKISNLKNMIESDSDSYGSEGGLKPKQVVVKKRGGKKRNKNGELVSMITGDSVFEMEQQNQEIGGDLNQINRDLTEIEKQQETQEEQKQTNDNGPASTASPRENQNENSEPNTQ